MLNVYRIVWSFTLVNAIFGRNALPVQVTVGIPHHQMIYCVSKFGSQKIDKIFYFLIHRKTIQFILLKGHSNLNKEINWIAFIFCPPPCPLPEPFNLTNSKYCYNVVQIQITQDLQGCKSMSIESVTLPSCNVPKTELNCVNFCFIHIPFKRNQSYELSSKRSCQLTTTSKLKEANLTFIES